MDGGDPDLDVSMDGGDPDLDEDIFDDNDDLEDDVEGPWFTMGMTKEEKIEARRVWKLSLIILFAQNLKK